MKSTRLSSVVPALFLLAALPAGAVDVTVNVGDPAPEFTVKADTGKDWKSSDHFGKKAVVVFFYPANFTGGCTRQACGFRDDAEKLKAAGVEVVGVSGDTVRNHQLFKKFHNLNFTLLADTEGKAATAFGVPFTPQERSVEQEIDGKTEILTRHGTARRWTFVVGPDGKVIHKDDKVNAAQDSQKILQLVAGLKK